LLAQLEREQGGATRFGSSNNGQTGLGNVAQTISEYRAVLDQTGTTRQDASRWQKIADIPEPVFEAEIRQAIDNRRELTTAHIYRVAVQHKAQDMKPVTFDIQSRFPVLYADPPWRYEFSKSQSRDIENQYPTMALDEIMALPVSDMTADNAVLFLWTTSPKLPQGLQVVDAWGFEYKTCMIWDKERIGMGYYARQQHELLLIATCGSLPVPEPQNRPPSVLRARRDNEHSAKPAEFYDLIERMYPGLPKIELFARQRRAGWAAWGNQA
jgi:N6-adenosine-specific RNA methylase IME4